MIELPAGQTAAQVSATFYQAGAAAGSAGFEPVVSGPLGDWTATPPGHQSFAEEEGCSNEDRSTGNIAASFGIHPGGAFRRFLKGTSVPLCDSGDGVGRGAATAGDELRRALLRRRAGGRLPHR